MAKQAKKTRRTRIGGQALLEGVMMRSKTCVAMAVRAPDGNIVLATSRTAEKKNIFLSIPIIRGMVSFFATLVTGMKSLLKSAEVFMDEEEQPTKSGNTLLYISVVVGLLLGIGLFFLLPSFVASLFVETIFKSDNKTILSLVESLIKLAIFISYLALVGLMQDIKRTYMYHGAEHKTINAYEYEMELTPQNVQKCSTKHDRCGTSFLFFVMAISIVVFALTNEFFPRLGIPDNRWIRMGIRLLFLPFVAGLSFEVLILLAKLDDNFFVRILKAPGMLLQKLTTKEPDLSMLEVSICAFEAVLKMQENPTLPNLDFGQYWLMDTKSEVKSILHDRDLQEEADYLLSYALQCDRAELVTKQVITLPQREAALKVAHLRAKGVPLALIKGEKEFYRRPFHVCKGVLVPRPETEQVVEKALSLLGDGLDKSVVDVCCGSGVIGATIAQETQASVTLCDISEKAIECTTRNCEGLKNATVIKSDMLEALEGQEFDMIISNPPYIRTGDINKLADEVKRFEPHLALDGGEDGLLFYTYFAARAYKFLKDDGYLVLEIGFDQAQDVATLLQLSMQDVEVFKDYAGFDRIVVAKKRPLDEAHQKLDQLYEEKYLAQKNKQEN